MSDQEEIMQTRILLVAGALALGGCASSQASRQPTTAQPGARPPAAQQAPGMRGGMTGGGMMGGDMAAMCPMAVKGTTARAVDVEGGAAIVLTTTGDVGELRRRVARMVEMHNRRPGEGRGAMGMMGGRAMMPPSTVRSEEVEGGARLVFTPRDPADLATLRERVGQRAELIASGRCPMMSTQGQGAGTAPSGEAG